MLKNLKFWFMAARGYSLPMSLFSFLVVFAWCAKNNGNYYYGLLSFIGIAFAHLGTNLFDDYIDFKNNVPKQDAKRGYFEQSNTSLKQIFIATFFCFLISFIIGLFFVIKIGMAVALVAVFTAFLCVLYPKLNYYSLGEVALVLAFGPNIFYGVSLVMGVNFGFELLIISLLVGVLTVILLLAHALMDFDSDKEVQKRTLLVLLKTKKNALNFLFLLIAISYLTIFLLLYTQTISLLGLLSLLTLFMTYKLYIYLKEYTLAPNPKMFLRNFILARNLVSSLDIILTLAIIFN